MKKAKISIAMTTYNGQLFLKEQLDSIYSQSLPPNEVIVTDDGSTDNTILILEKYSKKYNLHYFKNNNRLGVNKNFEKSISLCTGDYIAISDQDDIWFPKKLEKCYQKIKEIEKDGEPSLITTNCLHIDEKNQLLWGNKKQKKDIFSFDKQILHCHSQGCTMLLNKSMLKYVIPLPSNEKILYDTYIGIAATMIGNKYDIRESLLYYRHHSKNVLTKYNWKMMLRKKIPFELPSLHQYMFSPFFDPKKIITMYHVRERLQNFFLPERIDLFEKILNISAEKNFIKKINSINRLNLSKSRKFFLFLGALFSKTISL